MIIDTAPAPAPAPAPALTPLEIASSICQRWGVSWESVASKGGGSQVREARRSLVKRLRHETFMSLKEIGAMLGGRDHTTILYLERS